MADRTIKARLVAEDRASAKIRGVSDSLRFLRLAAIAAAAALGARALGRAMGQAVRAAGDFQTANITLAAGLRNTGQFTEDTLASMQEYARELQKVSVASETQILAAQALSLNMGATAEKANAAAQAAVNMAAALGTDLETAVRQINRTLGGLSGELGEIIPEIKDLTVEQRKAGAAIDLINQKFRGAAAVAAKGFAGAVNNLETAFNQLQVAVGGPFRDIFTALLQEVITPTVAGLAETAEGSNALRRSAFELAISIVDLAIAIEQVRLGLIEIIPFQGALNALWQNAKFRLDLYIASFRAFTESLRGDTSSDFLERLIALQQRLREEASKPVSAAEITVDLGIQKKAQQEIEALEDALKGLGIRSTEELTAAGERIGAAFQQATEQLQSGEISPERFTAIAEALQEMANAVIEEGGLVPGMVLVNEQVQSLREGFVTTDEAINVLVTGGVANLQQAISETAGGLQTLSSEMEATLRGVGISSALRLGDALVDAAFSGKFAFDEFFKSLLEQLARAIIQALILRAVLGIVTGGVGAGGSVGGIANQFAIPFISDIDREVPGVVSEPSQFSPSLSSPTVIVEAEGAAFLDASMPPRLARQIADGLRLAQETGVARGL